MLIKSGIFFLSCLSGIVGTGTDHWGLKIVFAGFVFVMMGRAENWSVGLAQNSPELLLHHQVDS